MLKQFSQFSSFIIVFVVLSLVILTSCRTDNYNKITSDTEDYREGDEYIYGESPDAEPRQTQNEYANTPESEKRAIDIRKKMFDKKETTSAVEIEVANTQPADSTVTDTLSTEE